MPPTIRLTALCLAASAAVTAWGGAPEQKVLAYCGKGDNAYMVGAVRGTKWTEARQLPRHAVGALQAFTLSGSASRVQGGAVHEDGIGSLLIPITPALSQECLLVYGAAPRSTPLTSSQADVALRKAILHLVQTKRPNAHNVLVRQHLTAALNGDGKPCEMVTAASRDNIDNPDWTDADFSLAAFVHRSKDGIAVNAVRLDVNNNDTQIEDYRFLSAVDLTGQGHFEVVLRSNYSEGQGIEIYDDLHFQPHRLMQVGWGL